MPKTMKQMKAIFKAYLQERVRVQRAAEAMVVAHQVVMRAQHDLIVAAVLQARHDQLLQQAVEEWENEECEEGV